MADAIEAAISASIAAAESGNADAGGDAGGDGDVSDVDAGDADAGAADEGAAGERADGAGAGGDESGDGEGDGQGGDKPAIDPAAVGGVKKDEPVDEHDFSKVPERDANGKINRIPHTRVAKMVEKSVEKATATFKAENETLKSHVTEYEGRLTNIAAVEDAMFNDQSRFIEMLKQIPGYAELLGGAAQPAGAAKPTFDPKDPPPAPDVDGGYSPEGLEKLLDWNAARAEERAFVRAKAEFEKEYGPVKKAFDTTRERRDHVAKLEQGASANIDRVSKRPHFKENAEAILKVLADDPGHKTGKFEHDLDSAYDLVVFGKLTTDRKKIWDEVVAAQKKAPKSTAAGTGSAVSRAAADVSDTEGADPIEAAIRASIRGK